MNNFSFPAGCVGQWTVFVITIGRRQTGHGTVYFKLAPAPYVIGTCHGKIVWLLQIDNRDEYLDTCRLSLTAPEASSAIVRTEFARAVIVS
ncbi:MAG: hypothetical protein D4S02_02240 [Rhodocyclaceae bacterium]|nr:MAG: hypothetical protein D4S02_02240 [Rhodocyclaceae bacterium]